MPNDHRTYLRRLKQQLPAALRLPGQLAHALRHWESLAVLLCLDLTVATDLLRAMYPAALGKGGRPPRDPVCVLRTLVLMALLEQSSFYKITKMMNDYPYLAVLAGFDMLHPVSSSTLYDFCNRFLDSTTHSTTPKASRLARGDHGRFWRPAYGVPQRACEQDTPNDLPASAKAVQQVFARLGESLAQDFTTKINALLWSLACQRSLEHGHLGQAQALVVSSDASCFESLSNGFGQKKCDCETRKCSHERLYTDADAKWGYQSREDRYFWGYKVQIMAVHHNKHDLPLHVQVKPGNTADVLNGIEATERLYKRLRMGPSKAKIRALVADTGYDSIDYHKMLHRLNIVGVISLHPRSKLPSMQKDQRLDPKTGYPLCAGNIPMLRHGVNPDKTATLFQCPAKTLHKVDGAYKRTPQIEKCPLGVLCEPESKMGPIVHIHHEDNPRLYPSIARGSQEWKNLYKQRTASERIFSRYKEQGDLNKSTRRMHVLGMKLMAHSLVQHGKVWFKEERSWEAPKSLLDLLKIIEGEIKARDPTP